MSEFGQLTSWQAFRAVLGILSKETLLLILMDMKSDLALDGQLALATRGQFCEVIRVDEERRSVANRGQ